jgi:photosystem I P700 chlorophyll a apoprotein A2
MSEGAASPARLLSLAVELSPTSHSILLTDIIHHHCAIAGIALWGSHTNLLVPALSFLAVPALGSVGLNRQISVACFGAASVVFWTAHQGLSLPSAAFIHFSLLSSNALYAHHLWIASALMVGAFVHLSHGAMLNPLYGAAGLLSHLSWIALFLGFHTLGIYVHNDAVYAFGAPEKAQMIQPIFVQAIQSYAASKFVVFFQWLWVLCPADFLVYHALGLGVHTVALIFLQGAFGCAVLLPRGLLVRQDAPAEVKWLPCWLYYLVSVGRELLQRSPGQYWTAQDLEKARSRLSHLA